MENNNKDYAEMFEQEVHSSYIDKLFWIAGSMESDDLKEFIEDLDEDIWKDMMPDMFNSEFFYDYFNDGEMLDMLLGNYKFGFIARVSHPNHKGFKFKEDGKFIGCELENWRCHISYIYAETIDELMTKIKEASEREYQEMIERDKQE